VRFLCLGHRERPPAYRWGGGGHSELRYRPGQGSMGPWEGQTGGGGGADQYPGVPTPNPRRGGHSRHGSPRAVGSGGLRCHEHHDALCSPLHRVARRDAPPIRRAVPVDQPCPGSSRGHLVRGAFLRGGGERPQARCPPHGSPHRTGSERPLHPRGGRDRRRWGHLPGFHGDAGDAPAGGAGAGVQGTAEGFGGGHGPGGYRPRNGSKTSR
jgi:hypothetical protein